MGRVYQILVVETKATLLLWMVSLWGHYHQKVFLLKVLDV